MADKRIVAIGLLTQRDLEVLGKEFQRFFPVPRDGCFTDLIKAIDEADERTNSGATTD